jgi:hypothetical protein
VNYKIVKLQKYSGDECSIYTVLLEKEEHTLFRKFVEENSQFFKNEIRDIVKQLQAIAHKTGARLQFFKSDEGIPGDGVCALYDEEGKLRLYCIRYGKNLVILGGGGEKKVRAWQDDPKLSSEAKRMIKISNDITKRLKEKEIRFGDDGYDFFGDLNFSDNDN